jgi:hypothetical protein
MSESVLSTTRVNEGTAAPAGEALAGGPASGTPSSGQAAPSPSWRDNLPADLKGDPSIAKFTDINALAGSYVSLQKMIGADKIPVPGKNASDQDWQGVYRKLGLPESADKYEIKAPEGASPEFLNAFKEQALKNGVLPKQAQGMLDWYNESAKKAAEIQTQSKQMEQQKGIEGLKGEWGEGWDKKVAAAQAAVEKFGGDELKAYLDKTGLGNDPAMIKLMSKIGESLAEDRIRGQGDGRFGMTPDEASKKISAVMSDMSHPYFNDSHPGHKGAVEEMTALFRAKTGGK